jgi:hypothetical protein
MPGNIKEETKTEIYALTTREYNKLNRSSDATATLTFSIKYGSSTEPFLGRY